MGNQIAYYDTTVNKITVLIFQAQQTSLFPQDTIKIDEPQTDLILGVGSPENNSALICIAHYCFYIPLIKYQR